MRGRAATRRSVMHASQQVCLFLTKNKMLIQIDYVLTQICYGLNQNYVFNCLDIENGLPR